MSASPNTLCGVAGRLYAALTPSRMLSGDEILITLRERGVSQADIGRALGLKSSRITELYNAVDRRPGKPRRLSLEEAKTLVDEFEIEESAVSPLSVPIARLLALYVARALGQKAEPEDPRLEEIALTIRAFSQFAADPRVRESEEAVEGFFRGFRLAQDQATAN